MKLYHVTPKENLSSIMRDGLRGNSWGIVYLSPSLEAVQLGVGWIPRKDDVILEVETGKCRLTAFEDCTDWEVLCWTDKPIPPEQLRVV